MWYVLLTGSSVEWRTAERLERRGYAPYWPHFPGRVRHRGHHSRPVLRSVMPGYLLLNIAAGRAPDWPHIIDTVGVRDVLRYADHTPILMRAHEVETIRHIEEALNASPIAAASGIPFKVGDQVRLLAELYAGWQGPILAMDKAGRITLEIALLGRHVRMIVPASAIEACG